MVKVMNVLRRNAERRKAGIVRLASRHMAIQATCAPSQEALVEANSYSAV
jgi:hypothetical protein